MASITVIAVVFSLFALVMGFSTVVGESGYKFDLRRRRSRRRGRDGRSGGRRESDRITA